MMFRYEDTRGKENLESHVARSTITVIVIIIVIIIINISNGAVTDQRRDELTSDG